MTRLELLVAAGVLIAVCALSCAQSGYPDLSATEAAIEAPPLAFLIPLQKYSFFVAAIALTLLGLLLEDGRRRAIGERAATRSTSRPPRV